MGELIPMPRRFSDPSFTTEPQLHRWDQSRDLEHVETPEVESVDGAGGDRSTA